MKRGMRLWTLSTSVAIVMALSVNIAYAAWSGPPPGTIPPANNVDAPINVGTHDQTKVGGLLNLWNLWINSALGVTGGGYFGGKVGIGVAIPLAKLDVRTSGDVVRIQRDDAAANLGLVRQIGGDASPVSTPSGEELGRLTFHGWGSTRFSHVAGAPARISVTATQDYTDAAGGSQMSFWTIPNDANRALERMRIDQNGFIGMGTPVPETELDVVSSRFDTTHGISNTQYSDSLYAAQFNLNKARGSFDAPTRAQADDYLGNIRARGYDGSKFALGATVTFQAEEDFNSTSAGTAIFFTTTPPGSSFGGIGNGGIPERMRITGLGDVGIGTGAPATKLQVVGDITIGTSGANGCLKRFNGGNIIGTCSSDARLKNVAGNVTNILDGISKLNLVTFHWNDTAAMLYHNGTTTTNTGFIAQDVQKQFPQLVTTDKNGYEQLDYTTLGLYSIEAIKELSQKVDRQRQEIDALKAEVDALKK